MTVLTMLLLWLPLMLLLQAACRRMACHVCPCRSWLQPWLLLAGCSWQRLALAPSHCRHLALPVSSSNM